MHNPAGVGIVHNSRNGDLKRIFVKYQVTAEEVYKGEAKMSGICNVNSDWRSLVVYTELGEIGFKINSRIWRFKNRREQQGRDS